MSAFLLGIGFRADMGTCARKLVLLKLIDACEDDGSRIFPANATVARAAQCSERQVQREIKAFLDVGLLRLVREGGKGPRSTNEYAMDIELLNRLGREGWVAVTGSVGENKGDTVSPLDNDEKGDTGDTSRVTPETEKGDKLCHPTPHDSSRDPSLGAGARDDEREGGNEGMEDSGDDPKKFEHRVKKIAVDAGRPNWLLGSSTSWTVRQFAKLTDAERSAGEAAAARFLAHCKANKVEPVPLSIYFRDRKWTELPPEPEAAPRRAFAPPFGPAWMALRLIPLLAGPIDCGLPPSREERQHVFEGMIGMIGRDKAEAHYRRQGVEIAGDRLVFPDDYEDLALREHRAANGFPAVNKLDRDFGVSGEKAEKGAKFVALMEPVPVGSERFEEWRFEHARRGWPWLPDMSKQPVVYFPVGGPDEGLRAFEDAVRWAARNTEEKTR